MEQNEIKEEMIQEEAKEYKVAPYGESAKFVRDLYERHHQEMPEDVKLMAKPEEEKAEATYVAADPDRVPAQVEVKPEEVKEEEVPAEENKPVVIANNDSMNDGKRPQEEEHEPVLEEGEKEDRSEKKVVIANNDVSEKKEDEPEEEEEVHLTEAEEEEMEKEAYSDESGIIYDDDEGSAEIDATEAEIEKEAEEERKSGKASKKGPDNKYKGGARIYHVSRHPGDERWQVKLANGERAIRVVDTQAQAIVFAKRFVKTQGGSIRVHSKKGSIRKHW